MPVQLEKGELAKGTGTRVSQENPWEVWRNSVGERGPRGGLRILYKTPKGSDDLEGVAPRDIAGDLREKYWIDRAKDAGIGKKHWVDFGAQVRWSFGRHALGRNRNEPGDGPEYNVRRGMERAKGRAEWFEVTEVFEGVEPKDVEAFMRGNNGVPVRAGFDREAFLKGLDLGRPRRTAQRRAADRVVAAVAKKLNKASYTGLVNHGYGTLIVGLPLWFATSPVNPYRPENAIDDFTTRVGMGLEPYARRLRKRSCPFWRIVVVWEATGESLREWADRARFDLYDDLGSRKIGGLPIPNGRLWPVLGKYTDWGLVLLVAKARPRKRATRIEMPAELEPLRQALERMGKYSPSPLREMVKWRLLRRAFELACFVRVNGLGGLERWVLAKCSPRRRMARVMLQWRGRRMYRSSVRRGTRDL